MVLLVRDKDGTVEGEAPRGEEEEKDEDGDGDGANLSLTENLSSKAYRGTLPVPPSCSLASNQGSRFAVVMPNENEHDVQGS